jgi:hypothetical protein
MAVAGLINGVVFLFDASNKMKYFTQLSCRNRSGKYKNGSKVTGVQFIMDDASVPCVGVSTASEGYSSHGGGGTAHQGKRLDNFQLLVSTNDSRIRLFRLSDFSLRSKFKGHSTSSNFPIRASVSDCGTYVISGSEQGEIFIWRKSVGRRKVRSTDAYNQSGDNEAYITNLRSGLSTLRNSAFESFDNDVDISAGSTVHVSRAESASKSNPALRTCFGSAALLRHALPADVLCRLYFDRHGRGSEDAPRPSNVEHDSKIDSHDFCRSSSNTDGTGGEYRHESLQCDDLSEHQMNSFALELSHNIVITADYNGVIRVFTKGF